MKTKKLILEEYMAISDYFYTLENDNLKLLNRFDKKFRFLQEMKKEFLKLKGPYRRLLDPDEFFFFKKNSKEIRRWLERILEYSHELLDLLESENHINDFSEEKRTILVKDSTFLLEDYKNLRGKLETYANAPSCRDDLTSYQTLIKNEHEMLVSIKGKYGFEETIDSLNNLFAELEKKVHYEIYYVKNLILELKLIVDHLKAVRVFSDIGNLSTLYDNVEHVKDNLVSLLHDEKEKIVDPLHELIHHMGSLHDKIIKREERTSQKDNKLVRKRKADQIYNLIKCKADLISWHHISNRIRTFSNIKETSDFLHELSRNPSLLDDDAYYKLSGNKRVLENCQLEEYAYMRPFQERIQKYLVLYENKKEEELRHGKYDDLTELFSNKTEGAFFEQFLSEYQALEYPFTIALFDIDDFKGFNSLYGLKGGDRILKEFGRIMKETFRSQRPKNSDIPIRHGGEEFVIILSNTSLKRTDSEPARTAVEKFQKKLMEKSRKIISDVNEARFRTDDETEYIRMVSKNLKEEYCTGTMVFVRDILGNKEPKPRQKFDEFMTHKFQLQNSDSRPVKLHDFLKQRLGEKFDSAYFYSRLESIKEVARFTMRKHQITVSAGLCGCPINIKPTNQNTETQYYEELRKKMIHFANKEEEKAKENGGNQVSFSL